MLLSKRGAAILQVLLLAAVLAGVATMILRFSVARTASARQNRRLVTAQLAIQSCMTEVNELWMSKSPEAFERDINQCIFRCSGGDGANRANVACDGANQERTYLCQRSYDETEEHFITANMAQNDDGTCSIEYTLPNTQNL